MWAGHFVNVVTPAAGVGGTALLLDDARRRGLETSRVALASTLYFVLNFAWFALLLVWGLLALRLHHALNHLEIAVLGACFAAFPGQGAPSLLPLSLLVAGYAVGTLFLIVSITPQGLGAVKGVMTALFVSLGVTLGRAAVVVLAYRGLSFWLPLGGGALASRRLFHPQWRALYLSYGGAGGLMPVATAMIRADSGQSTWLDFLRHLRGERGGA